MWISKKQILQFPIVQFTGALFKLESGTRGLKFFTRSLKYYLSIDGFIDYNVNMGMTIEREVKDLTG